MKKAKLVFEVSGLISISKDSIPTGFTILECFMLHPSLVDVVNEELNEELEALFIRTSDSGILQVYHPDKSAVIIIDVHTAPTRDFPQHMGYTSEEEWNTNTKPTENIGVPFVPTSFDCSTE